MLDDLIGVRDQSGLRNMVTDVLSPDRVHAVFAVTVVPGGSEPVLTSTELRLVIGPSATGYFLEREPLLDDLRELLGPKLAPMPGSVRVWWPGVTDTSDPQDHPTACALEGQSVGELLNELAYLFDLSRPHVRREIKVIEEVRALAEHRCRQAERKDRQTTQLLRDAHIERHREAMRAQRAEAALEAATQACGEIAER